MSSPGPAELGELLIAEIWGPVEVLRRRLFSLCSPQGFRQELWSEPSGFLAVEINSGHPSGDLSALPPDVAAVANPLLGVLKRKWASLPLIIYGFLRPVAQANKLDAFVVVEAEEIGVSLRGATHTMRSASSSGIIWIDPPLAVGG